jgi:hypothetical protein
MDFKLLLYNSSSYHEMDFKMLQCAYNPYRTIRILKNAGRKCLMSSSPEMGADIEKYVGQI